MNNRCWLFVLLLLAVALAGCGNDGGNGSLAAGEADAVSLVSENENDIVFAVQVGDLATETTATSAGEFAALNVSGFDFAGAVGAPALPAVRRLVSLPLGAKVTVTAEASDVERIVLADPVMPNQPPVEKLPGAFERAQFVIDENAYAGDEWTNDGWAALVEEGMMRNHRLGLLEITPVNYHPATGELLVAHGLTVTLHLDGADLAASLELGDRLGSPAFDALLAVNAANKGEKWTRFAAPVDGANYLIIYADALAGTALNDFISLKTSDGWTVSTKKVSEIGSTVVSIRNYIISQYKALPNLTFVLLVGDTNTIPSITGFATNKPPTDLYYSCMDATDYYPDVLLGRFPVRTTTELGNLTAKIRAYETATYAWSKRATFMSSEDNYTITEGTHNTVISTFLDPHAYSSQKLYSHTYSATTAQVTAAFNAGTNWGIYSGHGDVTYWADGPVFYQSNVTALTNTYYPIVASFACLTGQYTTAECFAETWVRAARGASAIIASSVTSYWTEDDWFEKGMFTGLFDFPLAGYPDQIWLASASLCGKMAVYLKANANAQRYYEMYNLFGDPSMEAFTY